MSDSDFEEEIPPVGLACKRFPSREPRLAMGDLTSSDVSLELNPKSIFTLGLIPY